MADLRDKMEHAKELLTEILDEKVYRSVPILAAEFQTEYPKEYLDYVVTFANEYNLQGCGYRRGHINAIITVLEEMEVAGRTEKIHEDGMVLWREKS